MHAYIIPPYDACQAPNMVSAGSSEGIVFLWDVRRPGPAMLSVAAHSDLSVVRTGLTQADTIK